MNGWRKYTCTTQINYQNVRGPSYGTYTTGPITATGEWFLWNSTAAENSGRNASITAATNKLNTDLPRDSNGVNRGPYKMQITLPGDYVMTADLIQQGTSAVAWNIVTEAFPTWSGAFLGTGGFYTMTTGQTIEPALYHGQSAGGGTSTF